MNARGSLPNGTLLGRYRIERRIGTGGMGEVFEAVHTGLKKRVAVKVLRQSECADDRARARFLREGENASRIRHPNVVDITDVGEGDGRPFLVMELLEGEPLSARLKGGPLSEGAAVTVVLAACAAVAAAHREGIIHRDLKPDNIFMARSAGDKVVTKVLDFGISKALNEDVPDLTVTSAFLGSPYYVSPELARGERDVDARADQYSLGVILFEMLSGVRPHHEHTETLMALIHAVAAGRYTPLREVNPDVSEELAAIVERAMENDPEARFASVREFAAQLFPFAPEAIQQQWGDYFERDEAPPPSFEAQASTLGTETTEELLAPTVAESALQPTLQGTFSAARTVTRPSKRTQWAGLAVLGAGVAVTVWFFATRPPATPEGAAAPESSPSSPAITSEVPTVAPAAVEPPAAEPNDQDAGAAAQKQTPKRPRTAPPALPPTSPASTPVVSAPPPASAQPKVDPPPDKPSSTTDNIDPWAQ